MMLRGQHDAPQGRRCCGSNNLVGVEGGRVEDRRVFIAITPLLVGEGVHREMDEGIHLQPEPCALVGIGHRAPGQGASSLAFLHSPEMPGRK